MNTQNRNSGGSGAQSVPNRGPAPSPQAQPNQHPSPSRPGAGSSPPKGRPSSAQPRRSGYSGGSGSLERCQRCGAELNHADLNARSTAGYRGMDLRSYSGRVGDLGRNPGWPQRPFVGKGPKGYNRTDERIREDICERLSNGQIDASEIEVIVHDGEVILIGTTRDRQSKRLAEELADCSPGIKDIDNRLQVQRTGQPKSPAPDPVSAKRVEP